MADSSATDNGNNTSDDENTHTNEIARIHKIVTNKNKGRRTLSKERVKKN